MRRSLGWWGKVCGNRLDGYPGKMSLKMLGIVGLHIDFLEFLIILYVSSTTPPGSDRPPSVLHFKDGSADIGVFSHLDEVRGPRLCNQRMSMSNCLDDNIDIRYGRSSIDVDLSGMKNDFRAKNGPAREPPGTTNLPTISQPH